MDTIGGQELLLSGKQVSSSLCYFVYENLTKRTVFENLVSAQPFRRLLISLNFLVPRLAEKPSK